MMDKQGYGSLDKMAFSSATWIGHLETDGAPSAADLTNLCHSIVQTVKYSDIFDYPLTAQEIHRYLIGVQASPEEVDACLSDGPLVPGTLSNKAGFYALSGRESIVDTRLYRTTVSSDLWKRAARHGRRIAALPFVRMVAVTGTLAVNNAERDADIDYLIVTERRRLWLVRSLVVVLVRLARLEGLELCPNYLIDLGALDQFDHSLFTAHELAQMIPLYGSGVYERLLSCNAWARRFFPNAFDGHRAEIDSEPWSSNGPKRAVEAVLAGRLGDWWERWIQAIKIPQLRAQALARGSESASYTPQLCKGHLDDHDRTITRLYADRLQSLEQTSGNRTGAPEDSAPGEDAPGVM